MHNGRVVLRDGRTGAATGEIALPLGSLMGPVQVFDGHVLVIGASEFLATRRTVEVSSALGKMARQTV